ncbi:MAG TPA: hypothetical protein DEB18_16675, partial [Leeuwenhoekiella sp.]|nr:hypothetical protein [Leeuwenhoekiella sp.]
NRVDADFYLLVIEWLEVVFTNNSKSVKQVFTKLQDNLSYRNLYDFSAQDLELDYLIFKFIEQLNINYNTASAAPRWLQVKQEVNVLLEANKGLRQVQSNANASQYIIKRLFTNLFEIVETGIYQAHLSKNKEQFKALQDQETNSTLTTFLKHLITKLPEGENLLPDNPELLALLSESEGAKEGLAIYQKTKDKSISSDLIESMSKLIQKYKGQQGPHKTGTILGQEVYEILFNQI